MKILIMKTGALGDVLRTSFIAQALKQKYKNKNPKIFWITSKQASFFFTNNPYVDRIVLSENKSKLKKKKFNLIINLEESIEDCKFVSSLKTTKIIGAFLNKEGKRDYTEDTSYWFNMSKISKFGEKKANILKKKNKKTHRQILSEIIKVNWRNYEPFLRLTNYQRKFAENFRKKKEIRSSDLVIGINPGGSDRWPKALPVKKTARLIERLFKKYKAKILLFGGPNEIKRNKQICKITKAPIIDVGCNKNLIEFPALMSLCNLVITTDSLGVHIALALKRKTICLIGPTSPSEIDTYKLGIKVIAHSQDVCSYKTQTNCMEKINLEQIIKAAKKLFEQKITLLITAFKEPETIKKAIEKACNQKTFRDYQVLVVAPDQETLKVAKKFKKKYNRLDIFRDPGRGKSYALNLVFQRLKTDILILTDGDVFISENSVENIANLFLNPDIGCVTGRPVPIEDKSTLYGYWANFLFYSAHRIRDQAYKKNRFLECSGYLFAFRKKILSKIPLDVAEDTIIPYFLWEKGYRIGYSDYSKVFVKNVNNFKEWIAQKTRTSKAHETLSKYVDVKTTPRVKKFTTEAKGLFSLLNFPENIKQFYWSFLLIWARLYVWFKVFYEIAFKKDQYKDSWGRIESTK